MKHGSRFLVRAVACFIIMVLLQWSVSAYASTPSGSIAINSGAASTNSPSVTLTMSAGGPDSGQVCVALYPFMCYISAIRLSNDGYTWFGPFSAATSMSWTLDGGYGAKTVYVTFSDMHGVWSSIYSDSIVYDTPLDPLSFTPQSGAAVNTLIYSDTLTITGISIPEFMHITGGEFSVNGGAYTSSATTISSGSTVRLRQTSSASYGTTTNTRLTIGGITSTFSVTTLTVDTTPNTFAFTTQSGVPLNTPITSNSVTVSGIDAPAAISITGGQYAVNGGAFTSAAGTVSNGDTVTVKQTSSGSRSTITNATLTIGGVSAVFSVVTAGAEGADTTPDQFIFTTQNNVPLHSVVTSNAITVSGIDAVAAISVAGGEYSINGGAFTSATGLISNGSTVAVRHTSSGTLSTMTSTTLTIGGASATFSASTIQLAASSVGYNPVWLVLTLFFLTLAGGCLMHRKTSEI